MISIEEALKIVLNTVDHEIGTEKISLQSAIKRVLAQDVFSDMNLPPFSKSAMDGYACRSADLKNDLKVLEVIAAGQQPQKKIQKNQCSKIMTGAMMPDGADCVVKVEETEILANSMIRFTANDTKPNFISIGEDAHVGDLVLKKGTLLNAQHIAAAAVVGCDYPKVYKKVRVGVISTGDELVEPHEIPSPSQIRNSNAYQLLAQMQTLNVIPKYFGIASDDEALTTSIISMALNENDVVLLTGGVSMGDFDFIPKIFNQLGLEIKFKEIAIQPGKPTVFGVLKDKFIFGLPGNPVSSFNMCEILVKPMIYKMMGHAYQPVEIYLPMGETYTRKKSTRKSVLPVKIEKGKIWTVSYHGSAHIFALTEANGLIFIPIGVTMIKEGEFVDVRQI